MPLGKKSGSLHKMSVAEIIEELPKLTAKERSAVLRRLREIDERDGLLFLHEAANAMFEDTDREEKSDARRQTR